jgi:hypothetical protein
MEERPGETWWHCEVRERRQTWWSDLGVVFIAYSAFVIERARILSSNWAL